MPARSCVSWRKSQKNIISGRRCFAIRIMSWILIIVRWSWLVPARMEYIRTISHLRPRTNTFQAVFRVRSLCAYAIHQSGKWYTDANIDQMLMERHLNKKARRSSGKNHMKGPRKRTEEDDVRFAESFEKLVLKGKTWNLQWGTRMCPKDKKGKWTLWKN